MLAVSDRFLAALRDPHVVVVEVDIVPAAGGEDVPLTITGGNVSGDRTAQVRRQVTVELAGVTVRDLADLLFGSYLKVRRGVRFADGTTELVQLGLFRVDTAGAADPSGTATLAGSDRMAQVRDKAILGLFAAGGDIPSVRIVQLVLDVFPAVPVHTSTTETEVLDDVTYSGDRSAAIAQLAQAVPAEAYFDAAGDLIVAPPPVVDPFDPNLEPVWSVDTGDRGVLLGSAESLTREGVANGVLVRGQANASSAPLEVLVVDDDPSSPTLWGGPFGQVVAIVESKAVQTTDQATAVARAELEKRLGLRRTLQLSSSPNPALEPGDIVEVVLGDGTTELHVVDRIAVPLTVDGPVTLDTRTTVGSAPAGLHAGSAAWRELRHAELEVSV